MCEFQMPNENTSIKQFHILPGYPRQLGECTSNFIHFQIYTKDSNPQQGYFNPTRIRVKRSSYRGHGPIKVPVKEKESLGNFDVELNNSSVVTVHNKGIGDIGDNSFTEPLLLVGTQSSSNNNDSIENTVFDRLDQTLLTNTSNYYFLEVSDNNNVDNMNIQSGVNFLAYCCNLEFHDAITPVIIPKGYYTDSNGQFTLTEELWELICPKCKQPISGNNVQGIGFRQCNVRVKYRYVDGVTDAIELDVDESNFSFAKLSPPGSVRYHFVKFQIKTYVN